MNWLVTGGCGFIGSALVGDLLKNPLNRVRVYDDYSVGNPSVFDGIDYDEASFVPKRWKNEAGLEIVKGSILDPSSLNRAVPGTDVLVHLAANTGVGPSVENPKMDCTVNVLGTLNCLEAARESGVSRFVFASSGAPLGKVTPPVHEEMPARPVSPYGASKLAGEGYCSVYFQTYELETVALRFGNVYGPGSFRKESVVAKFIKTVLDGRTFTVYGDGSQTRDYVYVGDLITAIKKAALCPGVGGELFQIATSMETPLCDLIELLKEILSARGYDKISIQYDKPRLGDMPKNYSDTSKAARMLDWKAQTALREGLEATVDSFFESRASS